MASTETCSLKEEKKQTIILPEVIQYIVVANMKYQNIAALLLTSNRCN